MLAARGCPESSHLGLRALAPSLKSVLKPEAPLPSHSLDVLASKAEPVPKLPFPGAGSQPELEENLSRITAKEPACKEGTLHPLRVQASVAAPAASPPSSPGSPKRSCPPLPPSNCSTSAVRAATPPTGPARRRSPSSGPSALAAASSCARAKSRTSSQASRGLIAAVRSSASSRRRPLGNPKPLAPVSRKETRGKERNSPLPGRPSRQLTGGGGSRGPANPSPTWGWGRVRRSARPSAEVRVRAPQHSSQHRSSSRASSAGPAAPAFKDQSATVRCPLLIGCAAASNQRLPLGLPGAHRLREGAAEHKSGGQEPEGRGRATPREQLAGGAVGGALEMRGGRGSRLLIWAGRTRVLSRTLVRGYVCATLGDAGGSSRAKRRRGPN